MIYKLKNTTDFQSMEVYKALISDFDGTLVDTDLSPSLAVTEAITGLIKKGWIFSIATGRPYFGAVKKACQKLGLTAPQIVSGGAVIIDPNEDFVIWSEYISEKNVKRVMDFFLKEKYPFSVDSKGSIYTPCGEKIKEYGAGVKFLGLDQLDLSAVAKISLEKQDNAVLENEIKKLSVLYPDLHIIKAGMKGSPVLDITSIKATKHLAVLQLSKILHISPEQMIGVGNGYNDYPLLTVCGFKAAMNDAPVELKEIADIILPDVKSHGLLDLINKL